MIFNETKIHGSISFPIGLYHIDKKHPRYEMVHHWHKNIEIIRVLEGELSITLDNRNLMAKKGDIVFVNSETVHGATPNECVYECVVFDPALVPAMAFDEGSFCEALLGGSIRIFEKADENATELKRCVARLFSSLKKSGDGSQYTVIGMLFDLYGIILDKKYYTKSKKASPAPPKSIDSYKRVISYIRDSYATDLSLEDMANCAGMSKKYFCTFFKQYTHQTPFEYLISYRIEMAVHFLITTDKSITEIAYSCGFNDLSYFIKTFKSIKGVSPGVLRKTGYSPVSD